MRFKWVIFSVLALLPKDVLQKNMPSIEKNQSDLFKGVQGVRKGNESGKKREKHWEGKKRKGERKRQMINLTLYKKEQIWKGH